MTWYERIVVALAGLAGGLALWAAATVELAPMQQAELAIATIVTFLLCNRVPGRAMTLVLVALSCAVSLRYIVWRFTETLSFDTPLSGFLGTGLALAEVYAVVVLGLGYVQTAWPLERKPVPLPDDPEQWPTVDVYIPSYNEDLAVVRATVLAALAMDWPADKLRVYILDDGRRTTFRDFARACGAGYIIRPDNKHAKAGNLNHALSVTDGEFVAIFDCDHVPTRAFLQMTLGWMVRDGRLGALQTPHHFYSPDPFQRNLAAGTRIPAEGSLFYGLLQDGNDFWNAAFFCGSCAVIRRTALESIGGFAVETVTEDAHTALKLHRAGWQSAYLRLPLAAGLSTERLMLHVGQRVRWARGMLQILRLDNPLLGRGLSLGQRVCYLNAMAHFLFAIPRLVFLTSPLAYLMLGQNIIAASPLAILSYAGPHMFHSIATNARNQGRWRHSFWSEIYETVLALFLVRITLVTLLSPRRGKFNVTEKGGTLQRGYFDLRAVYPNLLLAAVLLAGLGRGVFGMLFQHPDRLTFQALLLNSIWVTLSLLIVLAALAVGRETKQMRTSARLRAQLPVTLWLPDGRTQQGATHNISAGGAALIAEVAPDVADEARIEVEFGLGDETLLIPARVRRWQGRYLQVSWLAENIAVEARITRVMFGRADAWINWDQYPADRPLASLWSVLVSIGGLFRRSGRPVAEPDVVAATASIPASIPGTLAKQSLVMRPRAATLAQSAFLVVLLLTPLAAHAQATPGGDDPPMPAFPTASPAAPAVQQPVASAPAARPSAAAPLASGPTAVAAVASRKVVLSMHDIGIAGPMTMRGTSPIQGTLFGLGPDEVVTQATLTLTGAMSPALLAGQGGITVTLNEQPVGNIAVSREHDRFGPIEMPIDPVFFQDRNRLNFRFAGRYTTGCNDPLSPLLWASVSDRSILSLTVARLPARRDLARLPAPFFDADARGPLRLPFVLARSPSSETLHAAAIAASWLGGLADFRGASFPATNSVPATGNAVLVALGDEAAQQLALPPIAGPTVAEIANPNDPLGTILVIAGRTEDEVVAASLALSLGTRTLSGQSAAVQSPTLPVRRPYDAPAWISTDHPIKFGELVEATALQGTGYVPGLMHVPFRTAPDLYTWRGRPFKARVDFRAPPGPVVDVAASRLDASINGLYLRSASLAPPPSPWDWALAQLGFATAQNSMALRIPPYTVFAQNDLQFFFDARPLDRGACAAIPQDLRMSIDPDSTIDLSSAYHFTTLPNLALFTGGGFPFSRMADLADTAVVLPDEPGTVTISAFLGMMGRLGALTGYPATRVSVIRPSGLGTATDKDILAIGTLRDLADADLLRNAPFHLDRDALSLPLSAPLVDLWHLFSEASSEERRRVATALAAPLRDGAAAMLGAPSPFGHGRSLVAVLAGSPQGLTAMVDALGDLKLLPNIQGDLALLSGGEVSSYRAGTTYTVGTLPFWLWPDWLLRDRPAPIILLMLCSGLLLGFAAFRTLARRAARRTSHGKAG